MHQPLAGKTRSDQEELEEWLKSSFKPSNFPSFTRDSYFFLGIPLIDRLDKNLTPAPELLLLGQERLLAAIDS